METNLNFQVGDKVRVKPLEWFNNQQKNESGGIKGGDYTFVRGMQQFCGKILKVTKVLQSSYCVDSNRFYWQDWMLEDDSVAEEKETTEEFITTLETKKMTLQEAQEFVKNTKYIVWSEDESRQLQKKLFEFGCGWQNSGSNLCNTKESFLYVDDNLVIRYGTKSFYRVFHTSKKRYIETDDVIRIELQEKEELQSKFDPNTLKPFDKVLVRDCDDSTWDCSIFSHVTHENDRKFLCILGLWRHCIPYNEETKHLLGSRDEAPEFYKLD